MNASLKIVINIIVLSISLLSTLLFTNCSGTTIDVSRIVSERDSLVEINSLQKQELENMNACLFTISSSLDSISEQEHIIKLNNSDGVKMSRTEFKKSIDNLARLIARQRQRISSLEDTLNLRQSQVPELQKMISFLNAQLDAKANEIAQLKEQISSQKRDIKILQDYITSVDQKVSDLNQENQIQKDIITAQDAILSTGYIKIGTKKQLKEEGIISSSRLSSPKLIAGSLKPEKCRAVDIRQVTEISLNSKKPKILSPMPHQSYALQKSADGQSCTLEILDASVFWSQSFYLVIVL